MKHLFLVLFLLCLISPSVAAQSDIVFDPGPWTWTDDDGVEVEPTEIQWNLNNETLELRFGDVTRFLFKAAITNDVLLTVDTENGRFAFGKGTTFSGLVAVGGTADPTRTRLSVEASGFTGSSLVKLGDLIVTEDGLPRVPGFATASLPTCDGSTVRALAYDTDTGAMVYCDGSTWSAL